MLHRGSQDGPIVGTSNYVAGRASSVAVRLDSSLEPGTHTLVAVAHCDTDGDEQFDAATDVDGPYPGDGSADSATLTVPEPIDDPITVTTSTPPETPDGTASRTDTTTARSPRTDAPTPTTEGEGGLDGLPVEPTVGVGAAVALTAGGVLAYRRREE